MTRWPASPSGSCGGGGGAALFFRLYPGGDGRDPLCRQGPSHPPEASPWPCSVWSCVRRCNHDGKKQEYDTLMYNSQMPPPGGDPDAPWTGAGHAGGNCAPALLWLLRRQSLSCWSMSASPLHRPAPTSRRRAGWPGGCVFSPIAPPSSRSEHDWVQKVEQTQRDNGYTLTLEDLIVDQKQITSFYTLDWEDPACEYAMVLVDGDAPPGPPSCRTVCRDHRTPDRSRTTGRSRYPPGPGAHRPPQRGRSAGFRSGRADWISPRGQVWPVGSRLELDGQGLRALPGHPHPMPRLLLRDHPDTPPG